MASAPETDSPNDLSDGEGLDEPLAPPAVVAVVVVHDPGPWFEESLASLGAQEYGGLSVLVIDAGSSTPITARVAAVLPSAYVRRIDANPGFGPAANEVLHVVEGAAFLLFCHDDVALGPAAVRALVEEAFRSNAGVVTPKVVEWDDPARLLSVGESIDKVGVVAPLVERGELDQEQHDGVLDVFCAPSGCTLVRADLFSVLGGFDPAIDLVGEDVDLCWRAQVAGARVIAAPAAVVRHVEASRHERPVPDASARAIRHRLRSVLTCYGRWHLVRVVPQAVVISVIEIVAAVLTGHPAHAREILSGWRWNLARTSSIREKRRRTAAVRQVPDSEVRSLQVGGSAQLIAVLRGHPERDESERSFSVAAAGRDLAGSLRRGALRVSAGVWAAVALLLVYGSRHLLFGKLPAFADLEPYPGHVWSLFRAWSSGWRNAGLGSESPAPTAYALLGSLGVVALGAMSFVRRFLLLVLLPLGAVGAWRLPRETGAPPARLAALVTYMAIPLPWNAIARGRWGGLVLWAAAPWILRAIAARSGREPFAERPTPRRAAMLGLGLALGVVGAVEPFVVVVALVMAVGLALGGVLAGQPRGGLRMVAVAAGGALVAAVLHVPWTLDFVLLGSQWSAFGGLAPVGARLGATDLLTFATGPLGHGPVGWAFVVAAALPLLIGREWRLEWAVRAWTVALVCWGAAWVGQQSWNHLGFGPPEALLAPAAAALAWSAGLGLVAFSVDLRGYGFGWRQAASVVAAGALAIGLVPVLASSFDGRWNAPDAGFDSVLSFLHDEQATAGPFRVLWLGDPDVLPLGGWKLDGHTAYATTDGGLPTVMDRWVGSSEGATSLIADAVHIAQQRATGRLGRLLAPMGFRYVVVLTASAPARVPDRPVDPAITRALGEQLDLRPVLADPDVQVYRNESWAPIRTALPPPAVAAASSGPYFDVVAGVDLTGAPPLLTDHQHYASASGPVSDGTAVYLAAASSPHWGLTVDGRSAPRTKAFGWANGFAVDRGGTATLRFSTPFQRYALLVLQVLLWAGAVVAWRRARRAA